MFNKITDWFYKRAIKAKQINVDNNLNRKEEAFRRVLNTLNTNNIMVDTREDGIYIRLAGNESEGEAFSKNFVKVLDYQELLYTKEYFIRKFELIPDSLIGEGHLKNHCALWHCGVRSYASDMGPEAKALADLLSQNGEGDYITVFEINDGDEELGKTPRIRILNALKKL